MTTSKKQPKSMNGQPMNEKEYKEKMYAKLYDSVGFLVTNHTYLPKSIGKVNLKLSKKELAKLTDILWYIAHSELWKD